MPQFSPGELKTARAPITVKPSELSCSAELYLVSDSAKVATSGIKLFTSTGVKQDVSFPITMPAEGAYPVYLDIFTNGLLIGAYKAIEDVVIAKPGLPFDMVITGISPGLWYTDPTSATFYLDVTARITNPYSIIVSHNLECCFRNRLSKCERVWYIESYEWIAVLPITLNPGQSITVVSPSRAYDPEHPWAACANSPPIYKSGYDEWYYFYLRDENGNVSPEAEYHHVG